MYFENITVNLMTIVCICWFKIQKLFSITKIFIKCSWRYSGRRVDTDGLAGSKPLSEMLGCQIHKSGVSYGF